MKIHTLAGLSLVLWVPVRYLKMSIGSKGVMKMQALTKTNAGVSDFNIYSPTFGNRKGFGI